MLKRIAVLVIIPVVLAAMGFGGRMVMERSWDELVDYQSPYTPRAGAERRQNYELRRALVAPLAAIVVKVITDRIPLARPRRARTGDAS